MTYYGILLFQDVCILICFLTGMFQYQNSTLPFRIVFLHVALSLFAEIAGLCLSSVYHKSTWLYNVYILADLWVLGYAALLLLNNRNLKLTLILLLSLCTIGWMFFIKLNGIDTFANWAFVLNSITLVMAYFTILLQHFNKKVSNSLVWLCIAVLIYYSSNIPVFTLLNYLIIHRPVLGNHLYNINISLSVIEYILITVSFLLGRKDTVRKSAII